MRSGPCGTGKPGSLAAPIHLAFVLAPPGPASGTKWNLAQTNELRRRNRVKYKPSTSGDAETGTAGADTTNQRGTGMSGTVGGTTGTFPPDTGITGTGAREAQITRLYDTVFDRAPDAEGLAFWTAALNRGVTLDTVADLFVRSPEFQSRGALSNTDFVGLLYRNGLEREADATGLDFWTGGLQRAVLDRGGVALAISESTEGVVSSLAHGTGTGTSGTGTGTDSTGTGTGTGTLTSDGTGTTGTGADTTGTGAGGTGTGTQTADGSTGTDGTAAGTGTDTTGTQAADSSTSTGGAGSDGSSTGTGTQTGGGSTGTGADTTSAGTDGTGSDTTSTGTQAADGSVETTGTGTGTQAASAGDTGTGLGDDTSFSFVQIRTPDEELLTVRVVGEDLPVGSEVVDTASAGDAPDAVVFLDGAQEAALLSAEWFMD